MDRFLRLNPEEAVWIKNNLKYSKDTYGSILRHMLEYQSLRSKEFAQKNKFKVAITQLKSKLTQMENSLPEDERKDAYARIIEKERGKRLVSHHIEKPRHTMDHHEIPKHLSHLHRLVRRDESKGADEEIEDIRRKLERMNANN